MLPMIDIICLYKPIMTFYSNIFSALNFFFFFSPLLTLHGLVNLKIMYGFSFIYM